MPSGQPLRLRGQVRQDRESSMSHSPWTLVIFPDTGEVKANGSEMDVKFTNKLCMTRNTNSANNFTAKTLPPWNTAWHRQDHKWSQEQIRKQK